MSILNNLTDRKFGLLTVIARANNDKRGRSMWHVVCQCGNKKIASGTNLLRGHYKSCGCLKNKALYAGNNKLERGREWYKANRKEINKRRKSNYNLKRYDLKYKLNKNISSYIALSLRGEKSGYHWEDIVGYNLNQLIKHLEKQFTPGMNWENRGKNGWHIDHKIPLSVFNFKTAEDTDFKRAWSLKNLQPMWAKDNCSKGSRISKPFQPSLLLKQCG
jgi:hypothetical protein